MITHAHIHFNESNTPVADGFDDVYFSNDNGLAESDFVFYQHNYIDERLKTHPRARFVIAETGFGTGLNFLNAWQRFDQTKEKSASHLHFISFEKYPIRKADLTKALANWPELAPYAEQLLAHYPNALAGCNRVHFNNVTLDLWIGDVNDSLKDMCFSQTGLVDAWFLDGFAPSKNPDMWQQNLFDAMAHLATHNATFATFTAAGFVRRGLQQAGFNVQKVKGFGRKREMIVGTLNALTPHANTPDTYQRPTRPLENVAIIGGGIASATLAHSLAKRGINSHIFCADDALAKGASHNRQGALYPHLQADVSASSEFFAHSFSYALRVYKTLLAQGEHFDHQWCGVLLQGVKDEIKKRHANLLDKNNWPDWLIHGVTSEQASNIAGVDTPYGGLFIPQGGWLNPAQLVSALINNAQQYAQVKVHLNSPVSALSQHNNTWHVNSNEQTLPFSDVFICMGEHSLQLLPHANLELQSVRGQVSHLQASPQSSQLNTVLCHKGYFTPAYQGEHCMGATFEKNSQARDVRERDNTTNWQQFAGFYGNTQWGQTLGNIHSAKAAIRAALPDRLPIAGHYCDTHNYQHSFALAPKGNWQIQAPLTHTYSGLHVFTGLGARGLCSAPLAAETLVSSLLGEPLPVGMRVDQAIHPARFIIRDLKRGKTV